MVIMQNKYFYSETVLDFNFKNTESPNCHSGLSGIILKHRSELKTQSFDVDSSAFGLRMTEKVSIRNFKNKFQNSF